MDLSHQHYAALDLGSNSFHLLVAGIQDDQLLVIDKHKEMVRLAEGLDENNRLSGAKQRQALECLARMGQRLKHLPAEHVRIVGTNTLRKAKNSRDFLRRAHEVLGHPVEIISGREEARLLYLGVAHTLASQPGRRLVMDIGGGSTEVIVGQFFDTEMTESLHVGCVQSTLKHFADGKITPKRWKKATTAAMLQLQPIERQTRKLGWDTAIGASGTFRAIAGVLLQQFERPGIIDREGLTQLREEMLEKGHSDALQLEGLENERKPVFVGGVAIVEALFDTLGIEQCEVSVGALREGVVYDLAGRLAHQDIRDRTLASLTERFNIDQRQADLVTRIVKQLLQSSDGLSLSEEAIEMLLWAAGVHELGLTVAHSAFQKHGAYLLQHADLPGFSRQEQNLLAFLVLAQRRKYPLPELENLEDYQRDSALALSLVLRLGLLLCRNRQAPDTDGIALRWQKSDGLNEITLHVPAVWIAEHPLHHADLRKEERFLQKAGIDFSLVIEHS